MAKGSFILVVLFGLMGCLSKEIKKSEKAASSPSLLSYEVMPTKESIPIDAVWDKTFWKSIEPVRIKNQMGKDPQFRPYTEVKMAYDQNNLYVIFKVDDRFVRSVTQEINGPVYGDACVEFFFAPDEELPLQYFNLETNCGGTVLMHYVRKPREEVQPLNPEDIKQITIEHSMPQVVDPEITEPVTWILEYKIPLAILEKYAQITHPGPGVIWRANFYKTANQCSNPHYLTWSFVDHPKPNFHLPQYFGKLVFN